LGDCANIATGHNETINVIMTAKHLTVLPPVIGRNTDGAAGIVAVNS